MTEEEKNLHKKIDDLQKGVTILSKAIFELSEKFPELVLKSFDKNSHVIKKICQMNEKYNAKLRRIEQKEVKFYKWANYALCLFWALIVFCYLCSR